MKLHDLRPPTGSHTARTRVGRGIAAGKGKTAGRGTKGQKARAGGSIPPWFEGGQTPLHMRIPKLRGFKNRFKIEYEVVNVGDIARAGRARRVRAEARHGRRRRASSPMTINQDILRAVGLVRTLKKPLKILGNGELSTAAVRRRRRVHEVGDAPRSRPPAGPSTSSRSRPSRCRRSGVDADGAIERDAARRRRPPAATPPSARSTPAPDATPTRPRPRGRATPRRREAAKAEQAEDGQGREPTPRPSADEAAAEAPAAAEAADVAEADAPSRPRPPTARRRARRRRRRAGRRRARQRRRRRRRRPSPDRRRNA